MTGLAVPPHAPRETLGCAPAVPGLPLQASAGQMFGPRGVWRGADGRVWVADTGHHRILAFAPGAAAAELCLGQPDMRSDQPNRGGPVRAHSLYMPVGLCGFGRAGLAVADSWNHRILIWQRAPTNAAQPPDLVLGQSGFAAGAANRGRPQPAADTLFWPSGLYCDDEVFAVADAGNRRVLIWQDLPRASDQPADRVLGQADMRRRDQNGGTELDARGMVWPHALCRQCQRWWVADAGASRVMGWRRMPGADGAGADVVLGQADTAGRLHNRGHARPAADTLAMPYALAAWRDWLLIADTANSRLLAWRPDRPGAERVLGQRDFVTGGDNRWAQPAADSLCWPYGLQLDGDDLLVADTGNNRVQRWALPEWLDAG